MFEKFGDSVYIDRYMEDDSQSSFAASGCVSLLLSSWTRMLTLPDWPTSSVEPANMCTEAFIFVVCIVDGSAAGPPPDVSTIALLSCDRSILS